VTANTSNIMGSHSMVANIDFSKHIIARFAHSRHAEQRLICDFFGNNTAGFFVEVGANDPVINSQTFHLEASGWSGLLIEPLPHLAKRLRNERRAPVAEFAASCRKRHHQQMLLVGEGAHSRLMEPTEKPINSSLPAQFVECRTLDSLLENYNVRPGFEFLSIDVEGHESEVLEGFSTRRWMPKLILMEDNGFSLESHRQLKHSGYRIVLRTGRNNWYVNEGLGYKTTLSAKLQILRKLYLGFWPRKLKRLVATIRTTTDLRGSE